MIYSALDGIKNNLLPPEPVDKNLFDISNVGDLKTLPDTLGLAKKIADESDFIKGIFNY